MNILQKLEQDLLAVNARLASLAGDDPADLTQAVALVYAALARTDTALLQDYADFSEADLALGWSARARRIANGDIAIDAGSTPRATLLDAARLLRALEQVRLEYPERGYSDRGPDLEEAWATADGAHYLVPRLRPLGGEVGKPFLRRALLNHRVIPTQIGKFAVRLHRLPGLLGSEAVQHERLYGAAFFPGLAVTPSYPATNTFLIDAVDGFDVREVLGNHVRAARDAGCVAVAWPELTMPDTSVDALQAILRATALDPGAPCLFMVAGSWHRKESGGARNVSQILNGYGKPICEVVKWARFRWNGRSEAIEPGGEIHLLVGDGDVSLVAICRDFLEETAEVPYRQLNVDTAIVPSMIPDIADTKTIAGHIATAHTMRVRFGTRVLVVAQPAATASAPGVGRVLAFPADPQSAGGGTIVAGPWELCPLERR